MKNLFRKMAIVACVVSVGSVSRAQEPSAPPNPWSHVTRVNVHPGQVGDFEDYVKKIQAARTKLGLPHDAMIYQVAMGGSPFTYYSITPFMTWEEMDAFPSVAATVTKAYGEVEGARILKAGRSTIADATIEVYRLRLDLSSNPKAGAPPSPFVALTISELNREGAAAYQRILGKIKKAEEQDANGPTVLRYVMSLGDGMVTVAARPASTLAERAKAPNQGDVLDKFYGVDENRDMNDAITKAVVKRSTPILAYRPDLSRVKN